MRGTYAKRTEVPIERSKTEVERILNRYGATKFGYASEAERAGIMFEVNNRRLRFNLPLPDEEHESVAYKWTESGKRNGIRPYSLRAAALVNEHRRRWRALVLCLKAKLEAVESGIETFEEAFLAHFVLADGSTMAEHMEPTLAAIDARKMPAMLTGGRT